MGDASIREKEGKGLGSADKKEEGPKEDQKKKHPGLADYYIFILGD